MAERNKSHLRLAKHLLCQVIWKFRQNHGGAGAPPCGRFSFTLIELLVVIAIISLLVSILIPSLIKAKDLAKVAVYTSNLHHIGLGCFMYANDFDGVLPLNH